MKLTLAAQHEDVTSRLFIMIVTCIGLDSISVGP